MNSCQLQVGLSGAVSKRTSSSCLDSSCCHGAPLPAASAGLVCVRAPKATSSPTVNVVQANVHVHYLTYKCVPLIQNGRGHFHLLNTSSAVYAVVNGVVSGIAAVGLGYLQVKTPVFRVFSGFFGFSIELPHILS